MNRAIARAAVVAAVLLGTGGCRNPFDPSADIELTQLTGNYGPSVVIYQAAELGGTTKPFSNWTVTCHFTYKNKVAAYLTSVTVTYTDMDGNPVTAYKSIGGRTFKITFRIEGVRDNTGSDEGEGSGTSLSLRVVDGRVLDEITSSSYPGDKVMYANVVLRGQDDNGYDLRLEGRIAIFLYP
jgi:hypothetical protein